VSPAARSCEPLPEDTQPSVRKLNAFFPGGRLNLAIETIGIQESLGPSNSLSSGEKRDAERTLLARLSRRRYLEDG
jgi:hypothetical protein